MKGQSLKITSEQKRFEKNATTSMKTQPRPSIWPRQRNRSPTQYARAKLRMTIITVIRGEENKRKNNDERHLFKEAPPACGSIIRLPARIKRIAYHRQSIACFHDTRTRNPKFFVFFLLFQPLFPAMVNNFPHAAPLPHLRRPKRNDGSTATDQRKKKNETKTKCDPLGRDIKTK